MGEEEADPIAARECSTKRSFNLASLSLQDLPLNPRQIYALTGCVLETTRMPVTMGKWQVWQDLNCGVLGITQGNAESTNARSL